MYNSVLSDLSVGAAVKDGEIAATPGKALPSGGRRSAMVYNRFRKSKDLNMYSTEDLSCILGGQDKRPKRMQSESNSPVCSVVVASINNR